MPKNAWPEVGLLTDVYCNKGYRGFSSSCFLLLTNDGKYLQKPEQLFPAKFIRQWSGDEAADDASH